MSEPGLGKAVLELTTDDTKFAAGLDKAKANSKGLESSFKSAGDSAKVFSAALSSVFGEDLERRAKASATGILQVGGAMKLTDAEAKTHLGTLNAWIEKAARLGKEVPAHILSTRDALKQVEAAASLAAQKADALKNIAPPLDRGAQAAGLLTSAFGQFTLAGLATNAISSLSSGLLEFISTGAKLPAVEASYARLTASLKQDGAEMLANMNTATMGVVSNYDLMLSANKAMLLGLPVTSESMGDLAKTATILGKAMGQDATKSLDDLITALGRSSPMILDNLGLTVKVGEANELYAAKLGKSADALTDAEKKMAFYEAAMEAARRKTTELGEQTLTLGDIAAAAWARIGDAVTKEASRINNAFGPAEFAYARKFFGALGLDTTKAAADLKDLGVWVDTVTGKMSKLPTVSAPKPEVGAGVALPKLSIAELLAISDGLDKVREAQNKTAEAARKHGEAIDALFRKYSGADARAAMRDLDTVFRRLADSGQLTEDQIAAIVKEALRLQSEGATLTSRLLAMAIATNALGPGLSQAKLNFADLGQQIAIEIPKLDAFNTALVKMAKLQDGDFSLKKLPGITIDIPKIPKMPAATLVQSLFGSSAEIGQELAHTIVGAFQGGGSAVKSGISQLGSTVMGNLGKSLVGTADKAGPLFNSALGKVFAGALPVVGSLIGPLAGAIWGKLFGSAGRDLVKDFAATFQVFNLNTLKFDPGGGFDELHAKLLELGAEGEKLWIALTQGVGRNNPEQAKGVIDAITNALGAQKDKTAEVADAALESSKVQQEALDGITAKYADTIAAIDSEYKSLSDSVAQEAEEDVMGLVETQQRARLQQLADEKAALEQQRDAELAAKRETFDGILDSAQTVDLAIRDMFGQPLEIPYLFTPLNAPGLPVVPMALGGSGRVTSPTLFYSRGQEDYAFSGEGKTFGLAALASRPIDVTVISQLDGRVVARNQARHLPNELARVGVRSR